MRSPRVFIAEDDDGVLDLVRVRLELAGYSTSFARDGVAAASGILNELPDAVILDIGLPLRSGFEVLQEIRANVRAQDIPVLMLTARHESSDVQKALSLGAQDYLAKPFDDKKLLVRIGRLVQMRARLGHQPTQTTYQV